MNHANCGITSGAFHSHQETERPANREASADDNDVATIDEMRHYVVKPGGRHEGEGAWHDDRVKSWGGCVWFCTRLTRTASQREDSRARAKDRRLAKPNYVPKRPRRV